MLTDQAMYISGAKTGEELLAEKVWTPSGCIQVYDSETGKYVGIPSVRVHAYNGAYDDWSYTDKYGNFTLDRTFKGPVSYRIEWGTKDYQIMNSAGETAYYHCGSDINGALYLNVQGGEPKGIATVARALSSHYYGGNIWERINDFRSVGFLTNRFKIYYKHSYNKNEWGEFNYPIFKEINIWGKESEIEERESAALLNTTFHELGHAAMYFRCKKANMNYNNFHKKVRESWGVFIGWFMTKAEYEALGHDVYPQIMLYDQQQQRYFDMESTENGQAMTQEQFQTDSHWKFYTPLFIDLVDDSNQKEYFRIPPPITSGNIYPDDDIVITNYGLLYVLAFNSRTFSDLKSKLLEHAQNLGTTEQAINNYFAFYGV